MHRAFKVVISLVLLGSTLTILAENPQVNVSVYDDAQVSPDTLIRAEQPVPSEPRKATPKAASLVELAT